MSFRKLMSLIIPVVCFHDWYLLICLTTILNSQKKTDYMQYMHAHNIHKYIFFIKTLTEHVVYSSNKYFNEVFIYPLLSTCIFSTCIRNYYTVYYNHLLGIIIINLDYGYIISTKFLFILYSARALRTTTQYITIIMIIIIIYCVVVLNARTE